MQRMWENVGNCHFSRCNVRKIATVRYCIVGGCDVLPSALANGRRAGAALGAMCRSFRLRHFRQVIGQNEGARSPCRRLVGC